MDFADDNFDFKTYLVSRTCDGYADFYIPEDSLEANPIWFDSGKTKFHAVCTGYQQDFKTYAYEIRDMIIPNSTFILQSRGSNMLMYGDTQMMFSFVKYLLKAGYVGTFSFTKNYEEIINWIKAIGKYKRMLHDTMFITTMAMKGTNYFASYSSRFEFGKVKDKYYVDVIDARKGVIKRLKSRDYAAYLIPKNDVKNDKTESLEVYNGGN